MRQKSIMKNLLSLPYRDRDWERSCQVSPLLSRIYGCFYFPHMDTGCQAIASMHSGWEHVSVSFENRCPTFLEMSEIKNFFFKPDEVVFQIHPKKEDYINHHPYTLHMWRPCGINVTMPNVESILSRYDFFGTTFTYRYGKANGEEFVAIYKPTWATWDEVCTAKLDIFGDNVAIQFQKNPTQDINDKHIILVWKFRNNFPIPPKHLVL